MELKAMPVLLTLRSIERHGYSKQESDLIGNLQIQNNSTLHLKYP